MLPSVTDREHTVSNGAAAAIAGSILALAAVLAVGLGMFGSEPQPTRQQVPQGSDANHCYFDLVAEGVSPLEATDRC